MVQVTVEVTPQLGAHLDVQQLGEGLGQPVGDRLHHDALVVVVLGAQLRAHLLAAEAAADGEGADVVLDARVLVRVRFRVRVRVRVGAGVKAGV